MKMKVLVVIGFGWALLYAGVSHADNPGAVEQAIGENSVLVKSYLVRR